MEITAHSILETEEFEFPAKTVFANNFILGRASPGGDLLVTIIARAHRLQKIWGPLLPNW